MIDGCSAELRALECGGVILGLADAGERRLAVTGDRTHRPEIANVGLAARIHDGNAIGERTLRG